MPRLGVLFALIMIASSPQAVRSQIVTCTPVVEPYSSSGRCVAGPVDTARADPRSRLARLWPADTVGIVITGHRSEAPPWRGVLLLPRGPTAFEMDRAQSTGESERFILRNNFSWATVSEWRETQPTNGATLGAASLTIDLSAHVNATVDDIAILENAMSRLGEVTWDRKDDRNCANDQPGHASLFCILASAVEARMGRYHHRQPALELIRKVINDRWRERWESHQLMDFNNHPGTSLADIRTTLEAALNLARREASARL